MIHLSNLRLGGGREGCVCVSYPLLRTSLRTPFRLPPSTPLSEFKCGEREPRKRYGTMSPCHAVLVCIRQKTSQIMPINIILLVVLLCCVRVPIARFVFINYNRLSPCTPSPPSLP